MKREEGGKINIKKIILNMTIILFFPFWCIYMYKSKEVTTFKKVLITVVTIPFSTFQVLMWMLVLMSGFKDIVDIFNVIIAGMMLYFIVRLISKNILELYDGQLVNKKFGSFILGVLLCFVLFIVNVAISPQYEFEYENSNVSSNNESKTATDTYNKKDDKNESQLDKNNYEKKEEQKESTTASADKKEGQSDKNNYEEKDEKNESIIASVDKKESESISNNYEKKEEKKQLTTSENKKETETSSSNYEKKEEVVIASADKDKSSISSNNYEKKEDITTDVENKEVEIKKDKNSNTDEKNLSKENNEEESLDEDSNESGLITFKYGKDGVLEKYFNKNNIKLVNANKMENIIKKVNKALNLVDEKDKSVVYLETNNEDKNSINDKYKKYKTTINETNTLYVGKIKNNRPHGTGVIIEKIEIRSDEYVYVVRYAGDFKNGYFDGFGILYNVSSTDDVYTLESICYEEGMQFSNKLVRETLNYRQYIGEFDKGKVTGKGNYIEVLSTADYSLELYFYENKLTDKEKERLVSLIKDPLYIKIGKFKNGNSEGKGKEYILGHLFFEGNFKDNEYDGKGNLYYEGTEQKKYSGKFKYGKYNGKGTLYNEDGKKVYSGEWKDGDYK